MSPPSAIDIEGVTDTSSVVTPDPLTINDVNAKRAAAGRLVAGVAAWTSADLFKIHPVCQFFSKAIL
jgi:aromatic amino acid aminotransferase I